MEIELSMFLNGRMLLTNNQNFVWTEAMGCAPILGPSIASFLAHHSQPIHVFLFDDDNFQNPDPKRVIELRVPRTGHFLELSGAEVSEMYTRGHAGTATLWAWILSHIDARALIHLDGDNIYVGNVLDELEEELQSSQIVGYRRPQFRHPAPLPWWQRGLLYFSRDTVHTFAFGIQKAATRGISRDHFFSLVMGKGVPRIKSALAPVVDFFDRATLELSASGAVAFLGEERPSPKKRGLPSNGLFAQKVLSFSAVGSGYGFLTRGHEGVPMSYVNYAMASFGLYAREFLGEKFDTPEDLVSCELSSQLARLDKDRWVLRSD